VQYAKFGFQNQDYNETASKTSQPDCPLPLTRAER
jgi:hypothetical protein